MRRLLRLSELLRSPADGLPPWRMQLLTLALVCAFSAVA